MVHATHDQINGSAPAEIDVPDARSVVARAPGYVYIILVSRMDRRLFAGSGVSAAAQRRVVPGPGGRREEEGDDDEDQTYKADFAQQHFFLPELLSPWLSTSRRCSGRLAF